MVLSRVGLMPPLLCGGASLCHFCGVDTSSVATGKTNFAVRILRILLHLLGLSLGTFGSARRASCRHSGMCSSHRVKMKYHPAHARGIPDIQRVYQKQENTGMFCFTRLQDISCFYLHLFFPPRDHRVFWRDAVVHS